MLGSAPEMPGSDAALEPTLHQDLNGDGIVGAAPPATPGLGTSGDGFAFNFVQSETSSGSHGCGRDGVLIGFLCSLNEHRFLLS